MSDDEFHNKHQITNISLISDFDDDYFRCLFSRAVKMYVIGD